MILDEVRPQLKPYQLHGAAAVISAVTNVEIGLQQDTRIFYRDGPACTGPTFTYNYKKGRIQVTPAVWTVIAAIMQAYFIVCSKTGNESSFFFLFFCVTSYERAQNTRLHR